jgi:hypothetical protein
MFRVVLYLSFLVVPVVGFVAFLVIRALWRVGRKR